MQINADFHFHSRYSGGVSKDMEIPIIASQAELKGLHLVGTSDCTHPRWLDHMKEHLTEENDGIYTTRESKTRFIVTTEVEDSNRVHHIIIFPDIGSAEGFREKLKGKSKDVDFEGRPHLQLDGAEIVDLAQDAGALIGPSHAFTPWTSIYKEFDSITECYKDNTKKVKFIELGLSADTDFADTISELRDVTFLTNSDCHSPWTHRLGREFNRIEVDEITFSDIQDAIERKGNKKIVLNVGLNPREGKYHETACTRCYLKFKPEDALKLKRRCPECNGLIKMGVKQRISELSDQEITHPAHRPPYLHIIPLAEVVSLKTGVSGLMSKKVREEWKRLVDALGTEIEILVDLPIENIRKVDPDIAGIINAFRTGKMLYDAGGGGRYGKPVLGKLDENFYDDSQKTLVSF